MAESSDVDFVITEIGGTVGDIESLPFLEAIRQFPVDVGRRRCMFIHLTLVPYIGHAGELKTKPTQHSVNELRRIGIAPDMVVARSESQLSTDIRTQDRAVRQPPDRGRRLGLRRSRHLPGAARVPDRGRRRLHPARALRLGRPRAGPDRLGGDHAQGQRDQPEGPHRPGRQVRQARGRLPVGRRSAQARGRASWLPGRDRLGRLGDRQRSRRLGHGWRARTGSSFLEGLAAVGSRARSARRRSPASRASRTWASAWACTSRSASSPATSPGWREPTRPRWILRRRSR